MNLTVSRSKPVDLINLTYQAAPWLETTFRYSIFNPLKLRQSRDTNKDRSYGAKIRIIKEKDVVPQIAVGIRDIFGTGALECAVNIQKLEPNVYKFEDIIN